MEAQLVPQHGLPIHFIEVKGVRGNGLVRLAKMPFMLVKAVCQAMRVLRTTRPNLVIGFGGYASGPGGLAARILGIPLIIHEQNAVLGMTNKYLSRLANTTLVAFEDALSGLPSGNTKVVGNPVRKAIVDLHNEPKRSLQKGDEIKILIIGGSLGAQIFNQSLPSIFTKLANANYKFSVVHQVGRGKVDEVEQEYQELKCKGIEIQVSEFIDDIPSALKQCDLVVCRSGALTVSELAASGNAGIFVPLPHAVDDHQTANANYLVEQGAGKLVPQKELLETMPRLLEELLSDPTQINHMQRQARQKAKLTTTEQIVSLCKELEVSY
jgi:UDP-N-acetylglucosamine--N-acetylmuramyl-(pentapeptide) pyrophosphoryl-undecaprenol N-acetylglucosamine transferase